MLTNLSIWRKINFIFINLQDWSCVVSNVYKCVFSVLHLTVCIVLQKVLIVVQMWAMFCTFSVYFTYTTLITEK